MRKVLVLAASAALAVAAIAPAAAEGFYSPLPKPPGIGPAYPDTTKINNTYPYPNSGNYDRPPTNVIPVPARVRGIGPAYPDTTKINNTYPYPGFPW